ncbi:hypothetical protein [Aeromonas dhakensis]|uniref:hypothetical protein n=1 Tax=Aeromonas dhakensis TaxID=196024 RepID=UPI003B9DF664
MIKTTRINADLLASMQDAIASKYDLNAVLMGIIPEHLNLSSRRMDLWATEWAEEIRNVYPSAPDDDHELFLWAAKEFRTAVHAVTEWGRTLHVTDMVQAGTGWNNLYIFTQPVSNFSIRVLAVWADDECDAVEALEDWAKEQGEADGCFSDEIELDIEMWLSSPAYCVEAA